MEFKPNPNQIKVIEYGNEKPLLVEAGPGSGKTAVIVERIKHLIDKGVDPQSFLVITFTKKAAENLQNRLSDYLDKKDLNKMQISTIHSFCLNFLKDREIVLDLLDDDTSERKLLFVQKFREELGFTGPSTIMGYQIDAVTDKFADFTSFKVDDVSLARYVEENYKVNPEYVDLVNSSKYFSSKLIKDKDFSNDWRNARFLQAVKSYDNYLNLLDMHNYVDFNTVQLKTLEQLKMDCETKYKTIFVDEFQDTDPLQYEIFNILRQKSDYFTAVGDVDQHIYGFRSSFIDYFEKMQKDCDVERISLNCNYRSTQNIVSLTDRFIKDLRDENSLKDLKSNNEKYDNPTFLVESSNHDEEAEKIFDIIQYLKQSGKILDYGEVGVLYRKHSNKTIAQLLELFDQHNEINPENPIDYTIKGQSDLAKQDEIKSLIIMLWYITRNTNYGYILSSDELNERNLKAFCGEYFEPTFWSLSEDTKNYLTDLQDSFYQDIVQARKDIREEQGKSSSRISSHKVSVDNEGLDNLKEIFKRVEIPVVDLSKVTEEDKQFFGCLNELRDDVNSEEPPLIFDVFYKLLQIGDLFDDVKENTVKLKNLAVISQTIENYSEFMSETDVKGFFYFLTHVIKDYTSSSDNENGVQLMTVHSAKGLEFPVTIVVSLEENQFPIPAKDPNRNKKTLNMKDTFYTPIEYYEYKKFLLEKEEFKDLTWMEIEDRLNDEEELRIIYVAMTRAADLLILSSVGEIPEKINEIKEDLKQYNSLKDLDEVEINKHFTNQEEKKIKMTFSKYNSYNSCPFYFNMSYNMGFRHSQKKETDLGTVFHNVMDIVNQKLKVNKSMDDDELNYIINEVYSSFFDIEDNAKQFNDIQKNIKNYVKNQANNFEVIDSEFPFSIDEDKYSLSGAVDLIYKINDTEIGILDYKNAKINDFKVDSYSHQLFTYASALKKTPEFEDYDISEGRIRFVKSNKEPIIEITEELIEKQKNELERVAIQMKNEEYEKIIDLNPYKHHFLCESCTFKDICNQDNF